MSCSAVLSDLVQKYLSLSLYDTARFFAERLYYEDSSPQNLHLLAQCFFRLGKFKQTYHILQDNSHPSNRYLFAQTCIAIGKLSEAEKVLSPNSQIHPQNLTDQQLAEVPEGAAGVYLLGKIARRGQCREAAMFYFKKALEMDPSCWSALVEYNEMGGVIDISAVFGMDVQTAAAMCGGESFLPKSRPDQEDGIVLRNLEKQKMAENLALGGQHGGHCTSISLGKSSSTLHVPFPHAASPQASIDGDFGGSNNMSMSQSEHLDVISPGLTPIAAQRASLLLRGGNSTFPLTGEQKERRYTPTASQLANESDYFELSHADVDGKTDGFGRNGRRVSFGPPSRLSFSSYGVGDDDGDVDFEDIPPSKYPRHGMSKLHESSASAEAGISDSRPVSAQSRDATGGLLGAVGSSRASKSVSTRTSTSPINNSSKGKSGIAPAAARGSYQPQASSPPQASRVGTRSNTSPISPAASKKPNVPLSPTHRSTSKLATSPRQTSPPMTRQTSSGHYRHELTAGKNAKWVARRNVGDSENQDPEGLNESKNDAGNPEVLLKEKAKGSVDLSGLGKQRAKALVAIFASSQQFISQYLCREALDVLRLLPQVHFKCGFVNQLIGKAYLEMGDYRASLLALREMLRLEPYRIQGTDIMSTALWHMKCKKELCSLGQQVTDIDKFAPEAWCVVGNCFSLQQEHDTAIRFFERAIQVDPWFAYAHTLCGHEHVFNENLDKAMTCFRNALKCDNRHYNAWYGMGSIFYRQERLELAEYHFRKAAEINARSAVLQCFLGIVLHAQNKVVKTFEARSILLAACQMDPKNPQIQFQLAHILLSCASDTDSLLEVESRLLIVRDLAPKEPPVFVMLGQVCQRLGKTVEALYYYNTAIDLDPKQSSSLKLVIDEISGDVNAGDALLDLDDDL